MTLYKYLIAITILIICSNCHTDSDITSNQIDSPLIHFQSQIHSLPTKSIITETTFPDASQVGIFSWGHHKNDNGANTTLRNDLTNACYTKEAGKDELVSSTAHAHFPINPDTLLNFYAYYPYKASATDNPQSISFELKEQDDLMWSTPVLDQGKTNAESIVNLSFNHLLSAITLKIQKADDIQEDMILQSISLENYAPTAQLNIQTGTLTQPAATTSLVIRNDMSIRMTKEETTIVTDHLLCPTEKPVFLIQLSGKEYRVPSAKAFMPGKKQTYEFTIQAKDIQITGQIKPWEDGGTSDEVIDF